MMAHRVNDLSYGHLGEATYDIDEKEWHFSRNVNNIQIIQPLRAFEQCIPPALTTVDENGETRKDRVNINKARARWLRNELPQASSYAETLVDLGKEPSTSTVPSSANLMSMGRISDFYHRTDKIPVLALASGVSGHILRVIAPRRQHQRWSGHDSPQLSTLDISTFNDAYWVGRGGPILQISFAVDTTQETSWLAVRKAEFTTILRPKYNQNLCPASADFDVLHDLPPSRLSCNPVLTITRQQTGSSPHADIAFNPWVVTQFAIIDEAGHWTIWDIMGSVKRRAVAGKSGHISGSAISENDAPTFVETDAWARIMWISDFRTIVVCNRQNLSAFDLEGPHVVEISCPALFKVGINEQILDLKRLPCKLNEFVVLTSTRVFWLELRQSSENRADQRVKIVMSCRHFRDSTDDSMKVTFVSTDEVSTVLLYSSRGPHISTFCLLPPFADTATRSCGISSFVLPVGSGDEIYNAQTLCVLPAHLIKIKNTNDTGPGKEYVDDRIDFMQILSLSRDLAVFEALCSATMTDRQPMLITPSIRKTLRGPDLSTRLVGDDFLVDDVNDDAIHTQRGVDAQGEYRYHQGSTKQVIDARAIYAIANSANDSDFDSDDPQLSAIKQLESLFDVLKSRILANVQGSFTSLEAGSIMTEQIDLDETNIALSGLIQHLAQLQDPESTLELSISVIDAGISDLSTQANVNNYLEIYDSLVQLWVSSLAPRTPSPIRLAKEKLIRSVALELCLSSIVVALKEKSAENVVSQKETIPREILDYLRQDSQPLPFSPSASTATLSLLTPTPTASVTSRSQTDVSTGSFLVGDLTLSHLRNYVISIKDQPPLTTPVAAILGQWEIGSAIDTFKWRETREALAVVHDHDGVDEEDPQERRREEHRRRKRAERTLRRQREQNLPNASQFPIFGSQPVHIMASQPNAQMNFETGITDEQFGNISMTQPTAGLFGGRTSTETGKPKKKRVKGF